MKIDYAKRINKGLYKGYGYEIKGVELCCETIKHDLISNTINMSRHNPYKHAKDNRYFLGFPNDNFSSKVSFCPHCGKPIILNRLEDEFYTDKDSSESDEIKYWDEFHSYDFNEGQRFYNCKSDDKPTEKKKG